MHDVHCTWCALVEGSWEEVGHEIRGYQPSCVVETGGKREGGREGGGEGGRKKVKGIAKR